MTKKVIDHSHFSSLCSYIVRVFLRNLIFHLVKVKDEFFVTRHPINDRVLHIFQLTSSFYTFVQFFFRLCLQILRKPSRLANANPTHTQTLIHIIYWNIGIIKAVHLTVGAFVVKNVEFFVEECEEFELSFLESLRQTFYHFLIHHFQLLLVSRCHLKLLSQLFGCCLCRIKIKFIFLFKFLVRFILFFFPVFGFFTIFSEKCRSFWLFVFLFLFVFFL